MSYTNERDRRDYLLRKAQHDEITDLDEAEELTTMLKEEGVGAKEREIT